MMNVTRREPYTLNIFFDCEIGQLEDFVLSIVQNGKTVLAKDMRDALIDEGGRSASLTLSGEETALLQPCEPAWVQARAVLSDGEEQHSGIYELNVIDVLNGGGKSYGHQTVT